MRAETWRKSSYSESGTSGQCVELASLAGALGVRDSKHPEAGHLTVPAEAAAAFFTQAKSGVLDARW